MLIEKYSIHLNENDVNLLALNLKNLIYFDSPRFLIQEVQTHKGPLNQSGDKTKEANIFRLAYFGRIIDIFKDDKPFMNEITMLM